MTTQPPSQKLMISQLFRVNADKEEKCEKFSRRAVEVRCHHVYDEDWTCVKCGWIKGDGKSHRPDPPASRRESELEERLTKWSVKTTEPSVKPKKPKNQCREWTNKSYSRGVVKDSTILMGGLALRQQFMNYERSRIERAKQKAFSRKDYEEKAYSKRSMDYETQAGLIEIRPELRETFKLIENVLLLFNGMKNSKSWGDVISHIVIFCKLSTNKSAIELVNDGLGKFDLKFIQDIIGMGETQADDFIVSARKVLDNTEIFRGSEIYAKFYRLLLYLIGTELLSVDETSKFKSCFKGVEFEAKRKGYHLGADFFFTVCDTIIFILERGQAFCATGDWHSIFHSGDRYSKWLIEVQEVQAQAAQLSNATIHGIIIEEFRRKLNELIEQGHHIYKVAVGAKDERAMLINKLVINLEYTRANDLNKITAQKEREAPYAILVVGQSSIMKSAFTNILFYEFGKHVGLPYEDAEGNKSYLYTRTGTDKFWSGFDSSYWGIRFDDIAYMNPDKAMGLDPTISDIIQVVNNVPFVPEQAEIDRKGNVPVLAQWVCATTNTDHMNAKAYFSYPLAFKRRFPFVIELAVKKEYELTGGMIDASKIPALGTYEGYTNVWNIQVKRVIPAGSANAGENQKDGRLVCHEYFTDIHAFLKWYRDNIDEHRRKQKSAMDAERHFAKVKLCRKCGMPICDCVVDMEIQANFYDTPFGYVCVENPIFLLRHPENCFPEIYRLQADMANFIQTDRKSVV